MNKPNIQWKPISANNYSVGRQGTPIRKIAFHHIVGSLDSAYATFLNPNRQASAHFGIGDGRIFQFVDLNNTSWANGNWGSNLESITLEHEGDWRFGYWNEGVLNTSAQLVAWLRTQYPGITFVRHRDVSSGVTVCPADLPVEEIWNRATNLMQKPDPIEPPAPKVSLQLTDIVNRKVVLNKNAKLWDLTFTSWSNAKAVKEYAKGTEIEVSATAKHPLGGLYYLTEYSFSKGIMNGFNAIDCTDIVPPEPPKPEPPAPEPPKPEPPKPEPPVPPVPPTPEPEYPSWFIQFWVKLWDAIKGILKLK